MDEMRSLGWDRPDVILVTGDAYVDHPMVGTAVVARVLGAAGYRVGVIAQPDPSSDDDIAGLGEPRLFWGVTSGSVDSMLSNYTASGRFRKMDDLTPGGTNDRRPDRAIIEYCNAIRRRFKNTAPVVLGGIEASTRRLAHYDWWSGRVRRSIAFDARADIILYGMAEGSVVELAAKLDAGEDWRALRGLCHIAPAPPEGALQLPSFEDVAGSDEAHLSMYADFYRNIDPASGRALCQLHGDRYLVQNPPAPPLSPGELDRVNELPFTREPHPSCAARGEVRALDTMRFSITTHRGCFGECSFCSIAFHQGRAVVSRSADSIEREAIALAGHPRFKGVIPDIGGPTANMYGMRCPRWAKKGACVGARCLFPAPCHSLVKSHRPQIKLLARIRALPGVRHAFVASGIRHDLVLADRDWGDAYLRDLVHHHVSGQLKVAPEHSNPGVLALMGKPPVSLLVRFKRRFEQLARKYRREQYLTYYFIAAHPGCGAREMNALRSFVERVLRIVPEQVQIFTPLPLTASSVMYATGRDPFTGKRVFVERDKKKRESQKKVLTE